MVVRHFGRSPFIWAIAIYWVVALMLPRENRWRRGLLSFAAACAIELFKLIHAPALDAFRLTLTGKLLLGRYFSMPDIVAYGMGILLVATLDRVRLGPRNRGATKA